MSKDAKLKDAKLRECLSQQQFIFSKAIDLIKEGASRDTHNNNGETLLHLIAKVNADSLIPRVLEFKGDIDTQNRSGQTALQCLLTQKPVNFASVFLLMKAGAKVSPDDESVLYNAELSIDVKKLYFAIKQSPTVKNNTEQLLLNSLLQQSPINFNAVALLVFAGAGLLKNGKPNHSAIEYIDSIDTVNGGMSSTPIIAAKTLRSLAKGDDAKDQVIHYIKPLPVKMKEELLKQGLCKTIPLGFFFGVSRLFFACTKSSGAWATLREMQDNLYPANSYTPEVRHGESSSSIPVRSDAPPPYNPALFGLPRNSIESPQPYVFGSGSPPL